MPRRADDGLRALFRAKLREAHVTTIETGSVQTGVPDMHVQMLGGAGAWVECKAASRSRRRVALRPSQIAWLSRHVRHGGTALVAVRRRCKAGKRQVDELHLYRAVEVLREGFLLLPPLAGRLSNECTEAVGRWYGGPSRWDWPAVRDRLVPV